MTTTASETKRGGIGGLGWTAIGCGGLGVLALCGILVAGLLLVVLPGGEPGAEVAPPAAGTVPTPAATVPATPAPAGTPPTPAPSPVLNVAGTPLAFADASTASGTWTGRPGAAQVAVAPGQFSVLPAAGSPVADGIVQADIVQVEGEPARWMGLLLRYQDPNNLLVASVSGDRTTWQFYHRQAGTWTTVVTTPLAAGIVQSGEPVRLRVESSGDLFTIVINSVAVGTVRDSTWSRGGIGVAASSPGGPVTVRFGDVALDPLSLRPEPAQLAFPDATSGSSRVTAVPGGSQLEITAANVTSVQTRAWGSWADVRVEATVQQVGGPAASDLGFMLRVRDLQQFMFAALSQDGTQWVLFRRQGGQWVRAGGGPVPAGLWRPGQPNRFAVEARGEAFTFSLNGQVLGEAQDGAITQGGLGFAATSPASGGGVILRFTDWAVEPPGPAR